MFITLFCLASAIGGSGAPKAPPLKEEPTRIVVVARTWEEAEAMMGDAASSFFMSGPPSGEGLMKHYSAAKMVLWRDPFTGLIVGFSTKK
jgi:hypothetical protein